MNLDLKYYAKIFVRRSPYFLALLAIFTSIGLTLAFILPAEYEARATMLVENAQIPENLAASTVRTAASEQLQIIEQRLLTRENLLEIANQLDVFPLAEGEAAVPASEIVENMRARTSFNMTGRAGGRNRQATATIVSVSFRADNPRKAAEVANEFVTRVLQENVGLRTGQAGDTLEFFEQEVTRLGTELDTQSARLLEFQDEAGVSLPTNLQFLQGRVASLRDRIEQRSREILALEDQKERTTELFNATGGLGTDPARGSPLQRQLEAVRQELLMAQVVFSDTNPKLALLRNRVTQLEGEIASQLAIVGEEAATEAASQQQTLFQAQIAEIDARILQLRDEVVANEQEIEVLEEQIAETATNGLTLARLQRDYNNIQGQYNQATARLSAAATGERIELLSKGQRITVIEQATPPQSPTKPNRQLIALSGVGAGLASGFGLVVLLELLNRSIRRPVELTKRLGITPLATIPYIRTEREIMLRRAAFAAIIAFVLFGVPGILYSVHTLVTPLDALAEPYLNRMGVSIAG